MRRPERSTSRALGSAGQRRSGALPATADEAEAHQAEACERQRAGLGHVVAAVGGFQHQIVEAHRLGTGEVASTARVDVLEHHIAKRSGTVGVVGADQCIAEVVVDVVVDDINLHGQAMPGVDSQDSATDESTSEVPVLQTQLAARGVDLHDRIRTDFVIAVFAGGPKATTTTARQCKPCAVGKDVDRRLDDTSRSRALDALRGIESTPEPGGTRTTGHSQSQLAANAADGCRSISVGHAIAQVTAVTEAFAHDHGRTGCGRNDEADREGQPYEERFHLGLSKKKRLGDANHPPSPIIL